ncbi:MAG TPA: OmpA family protein [Aquaticitalea sp.]|nr:OmpA family protein [Aquaticitalea sp.]HNU58377.1 OmpA family protein [Aquaticitalea sp.]
MKILTAILFILPQFIVAQQVLTHEVYFETDKSEMTNAEHERLLQFLTKIESLDIDNISIYGFCDDRGSKDYNLKLSQDRANAIKTIFSNNEFDESVMTNVDGKGEILLKTVEEHNVDKIRSLNRKVQIIATTVFPPKPEVKKTTKNTAEILRGEIKAGDNIVLENLLFQTSYSYLLPESVKVLEEITKVMLERTDIYFTIKGHVCCTQNGRDAIDRKTKQRNLSQARAKYIYDYMAKRGVDKKRMKYVGMRRKFPLGGEPKYDRRVEILITHAGSGN